MYFYIKIERLLRNEFGIINNYYGDHHFIIFRRSWNRCKHRLNIFMDASIAFCDALEMCWIAYMDFF